MRFQQPSLKFLCPRCGAEISETIEEVAGYDVMADRESDAQGFTEQVVECSECDGQFTVNIRNTGASAVAELADGEAIVSVVDDTIRAVGTQSAYAGGGCL